MPRTKGAKSKNAKGTTTKKTKTNCHCGPGYECKCKSKTKTKRTTKPKTEQLKNPLSNTIGLSRPASENLGFHPRGLINNEPQQPTIIQQITSPPDPRLEKLDKRTKKIKEYLKSKGDTKENAINVNSPSFENILGTQQPTDIFSDAMEPRRINFESVPSEKPKRGLLSRIFTSSKKKEQKQEGLPLLEYKPPKPPATAPAFTQTESIETQTTPIATGHVINQELKNLVNQLHSQHPRKLKMGTFRSAIAKKLRDLGVDTSHTSTYVEKMRDFYDEIYAASKGGEAAGGVM